jgi:hypothetical protein
MKFVSDLWQVGGFVGGFLWVFWFPPLIKITEILLKVALSTKTLTPNPY